MIGPDVEDARGDLERVRDMLEAIRRIDAHRQFVEPEPAAISQPLVRDAVLYNLVVLGEAAGAVSEPTRDLAPDVPFPSLKGLRNLVAHRYFHVEMERIWGIVEELVPGIEDAVRELEHHLGQ